MDLGALEGQTMGDYFLDSIFDPSVNQCNLHLLAVSGFHRGCTLRAEKFKISNCPFENMNLFISSFLLKLNLI